MAGPDEVLHDAKAQGVPIKLFSDLGSVRTVVEAAQQTERGQDQVGRTVLIRVRDEPFLVIVPGHRRVDGDRIGRVLGARPAEVTLATRQEVRELTGYSTETVPPFGLAERVEVLLDTSALEHETLLLPSGDPEALVEVDIKALARLDHVRVGDWSRSKDQED